MTDFRPFAGFRRLLQHLLVDFASFEGTDLSGLDFRGANFDGANFAGANLSGANFTGADLLGANLSRADLSCAYFRDSIIRSADIQQARFDDSSLLAPLPDAPERLLEVAANVLLAPSTLEMSRWHGEENGCNTTHCLAGWAIFLAGDLGAYLERHFGPDAAGRILLGDEAASYFYESNEAALAFLRSVMAKVAEPPAVTEEEIDAAIDAHEGAVNG